MSLQVVVCRSNPIEPDPRVEKIGKALSSKGYVVKLVGWDRTGKSSPEDETNHIQIYRLSIPAEFGHGLANLPNLLRWQWGLFRWLVTHHKEYNVIHACDFDTIIPALINKILWGKKVIYDIFDFYAEHLRATPNFLKSVIRIVDMQAINWSDALILADDSRKAQIKGAKPKRSAVIFNSPEEIDQADILGEASQPDSQFHPSSRLHLAYIGLLQVERGLLEMLEIMQSHPEWALDLAGYGGDENKIYNIALELPNVFWHGRVTYQRAIQLSQAADVLFATYDPTIPNHRYSSPNKVFEAMMLGKPIVVARGTNMDRIIEDADCGIVVEYGDVSAIENTLTRLQEDLDLRNLLGANARRAYETTYSWAKMRVRLLNLYEEVTESTA